MTKQNYFSTSFLTSLFLHIFFVFIAILFLPEIKNIAKQQYLNQYEVSIVIDTSYLDSNKMTLEQKIEIEIDENSLPNLPTIEPIKEVVNFRNIKPVVKYKNANLKIQVPKPPVHSSNLESFKNNEKPKIIDKNIIQDENIPKNPIFHENPLSQLTLKTKIPNNTIEELMGIETNKKSGQCRTVYIPTNYHNFKITNGNELIESATNTSNKNQVELQLYAYQVLVPSDEINSIYKNGNNTFGNKGGDNFNTWSQSLKNYESKVYYTRQWIYKYAIENEKNYTSTQSQSRSNPVQFSQAIVCD